MRPNPADMPISELAARSGLPVSTIKFYIREGILAPPAKPARTRGRYDERHLDRIRLIQELRHETDLPLSKIKGITRMLDAREERERRARTPDPTGRQEEIAEASLPLFRQKGYESVTIAEIVDAAGIGRSTFYKSFPNKKELFLACIERILRQEQSQVAVNGIEGESDPVTIFERHAQALMRVDPLWRDMIHMLRAAAVSDPGEFQPRLDEAMRLKVAAYEKRLQGGMLQGLLRRELDPKVLAVMILGIQDTCSDFMAKGHFRSAPKHIFEQVTNVLLHGMLNR